jgi:hypothetical protein
MIPVAMLIVWGGYALGSWGWAMTKGYDITLRSWVSPLHPYQWPPGGVAPATIPANRVWPAAAPAAGTGQVIT